MEAPNTRSASVLSPSVTATLRMLSPQRMTFMLLEASQPAQARAQVPTFFGDLRIGVVADDDLALDAEAGDDVTELTVAVGGLVQVHEVHVDGLPRDFLVVLGGQLQQRLGQHFEAADPHLGRGEGVAPGDDADDVRVGGSLDHEGLDAVGGLQGGLEDDLGRNLAGVVEVVDHFSGVNGDLAQGFFAVQVLRSDAEPDFLAFEGFSITIGLLPLLLCLWGFV
jgi:hypothetical protein